MKAENKGKTIYLTAGIVTLIIAIGVAIWISISGVLKPSSTKESGVRISETSGVEFTRYAGKKILYIDSYHEGYAWSDGITRGINEVVEGSGVELLIHRMDTKRNTTDEFKKQAALEAKAIIEAFDPDVVIVSDDNAFKYLVQEYYRNDPLPFVFSGLNWDASLYGAPYRNTTGMVEVSLTLQIIDQLRQFAKGDRVGYLTADVLTERKNLTYYESLFDLTFEQVYFVTTLLDWKKAFIQLQQEVDMIIFENNAGIVDWDDVEARSFALSNVKVPIGTTNPWIMEESLLGITKIPEEQGQWSTSAALLILDGTEPSAIPVVRNKRGNLMINLKMAEKLNIVFPPSILKNAEIVN